MQLQQLIINLVVNGIEATSIITDRKAPKWSFDPGRRTAEAYSSTSKILELGSIRPQPDRWFDPFFTTKPNGMGMGLLDQPLHRRRIPWRKPDGVVQNLRIEPCFD